MREKYILRKHFLSPTLQQSEIISRASDSNKTIESVLAFLMGLYPESPELTIM